MTANWKDVRRASIPVSDLPVLAELRGRGEIRVLIAGEVAWVSWEPGSELMEEMLVRRILPLDGAVLYTERDGRWYRLGEHLPAFDVPRGDGSDWPLLERAIFPEPVRAVQSRERLASSDTDSPGARRGVGTTAGQWAAMLADITRRVGGAGDFGCNSPRSRGPGSDRIA